MTAGFGACGGVLEHLEGGVRLESLAERLGTLCTDVVALETANESACMASRAADAIGLEFRLHIRETRQRAVHFERRRDVLPELGTDKVLREAIQAQERNKR